MIWALCGLLLIRLYSQHPSDVLVTGPMLFIQPAEPCEVYLDGTLIGTAPLFIQSVTRWNATIQLKGPRRYAEAAVQFNPDLRTVTRFTPELVPYYGIVDIQISEPDARITVNGSPLEGPLKFKQTEGSCIITAEKDGFFTVEQNIEVVRLQTTAVSLNLKPAVPVSFSPEPPEGCHISLKNLTDGTVIELAAPIEDQLFLSSGRWETHITHNAFEPILAEFSVSNEAVLVPLNIRFYQPGIRLSALKKNSIVYLNGAVIETDPVSGVIPASAGINQIEILAKGYLSIRKEINLTGNEVADLPLEYTRDPVFQKARNTRTGIILMSSGLALLAGGLVLNSDAVLVPASGDYDTYSMMKYATLGIAGTGAAAVLAGSGFALPLIIDLVQ
ncbi:MAG: hypothetical protein JXB03_09330 [Spirochaetales bacterium]|nr:hypothetical protein [Spirochaetales bacterium]